MNWIESVIIVSLFLILLVIVAQILLDRKYKLLKPIQSMQEQDATYERIKQLKNELRQDTKDKTAKNPVFDILIKHKSTDKLISKYKPEFSVSKPLKLEELQEELDITKKDITEEEIDDVQEDQSSKKVQKDRKIEDLIRKNVASDDTIINQNNYFKLSSGRYVRNMRELVEAIEQMPHTEFEKHVNLHNNDFANWLEHTFKNKDLANELRKDTSKRHALFVLKNNSN